MRVRKIHIPFGVVGIVLGVVFFVFGNGDPFFMWMSGFSIGWGVIQAVLMVHLWTLE